MTPLELMIKLRDNGGAIVMSDECSALEIAVAQTCGRFAVDEDGIGYLRRPKEWLEIAKNREKAHPNFDGQYGPRTVAVQPSTSGK